MEKPPDVNITEIFSSIQGEGQTIGTPALFVRLSGCNLRCPFCDTKYSYDKGITLTATALSKEYLKARVETIVLTGGEPTLQYVNFKELIRRIDITPKRIIIETNATNFINPIYVSRGLDYFVLSPKFYSDNSYDYDVIKLYLEMYPSSVELKMLYFNKRDWDIIEELLKKLHADKVVLKRPVTFQSGIPSIVGNPMELREVNEKLVDIFLESQHRIAFYDRVFITQQHKAIWGVIKRGV